MARPTMKEVARLAGNVHPSTVSLALRNSPRVSPEVREKIQAAARRVGYRRDPLLDAFNQHRLKVVPQKASRHIAAIADFSSMTELENSPLHAAARQGAAEAAARLHCQLDFFFCGPGRPSPRRLDAMLDARGLRALLLFGIRGTSPPIDLTWSRNCTVAIDSLQLATPIHRVTPDYREATRLLWRQAWTQGFQRIAIIRSDPLHPITEDRAIAGFLLEQFRHPQATAIPIFNFTNQRETRTAFKRWLHTHRPQVILHASVLTKSLVQLITDPSVRCLVFDALGAAEAGMGANYFEVGRRAVEQLVTLMQTNQPGLPVSATYTYIPPSR